MIIGRCDLVDVLTLDEFKDTVPKILQEPTVASYQFVLRNPNYLDMPLRMAGQPNIYKMEKNLFLGVKPLLKKTPFSWWPPREFELYNVGQFDIYPIQYKPEYVHALIGGQQLLPTG
jgi:hypothetical protein